MKKIYIAQIIILIFLIPSIRIFSQTIIDKSISSDTNTISAARIYPLNADIFSYPNPASKTITFTFKGVDINAISVEVYELTGQPILTFKSENIQYILDVTSMKEGIYFYKVLYNGKVIKTEKFVILKK